MRDFDYFEPKNTGEAVSLLVRYGEAAKILAGGTDLLVKMQSGVIKPGYLINLRATPDLDYIDCNEEGKLRIGATTTIRSLEKSTELHRKFPTIVQFAKQFSSISIRTMATLGGNLCNASPGADSPAPLIALSATARIIGPDGTRTVPVEDFFTGPGSTVMKPDEILAEVEIPALQADTKWAFLKYWNRSKSDLAIVSVAVLVKIKNGIFNEVKIALGAVAPTPIRVPRAEECLKGEKASEKVIEEAAKIAADEIKPISDVRASAEYRKQISYVLTKRAIMSCLNTRVGG